MFIYGPAAIKTLLMRLSFLSTAFVLFSIFSLFFTRESQAQILNIERHRLTSDTTNKFLMNGRFSMTVNNRSAAKDNPVNLFGINTALNAIYRTEKHGYIFIGQTDYLTINDNEFLNFGFAHFRVNFFRERKVNYEAFTQASYDNFRGLDPRIIFGGAVRLRLLKTDKAGLTAGLGGFYENETWTHPETGNDVQVEFFKLSTYLSMRRSIGEQVDFNAVVYYQTGYDDRINDFRHRVSGNFNLNTRITRRLSLNNSFELSYEDKPIVPITKFIYALRTGLLISL